MIYHIIIKNFKKPTNYENNQRKTIQEINPRISILFNILISFQGENILENFNNTFQVKESLTESYYLYTYDSEELLIKDLLLQLSQLNLLEGNDDQFFDYNPDNLETIFNGSKLLTNKSQQQEILQKLAKLIETFYEESDNQEMIDIYAKFYLPILELKYNIQPNQK